MCNHRISIFFAQILHGTLEYGSTQTVEVQEGSEKKSQKRGGLDRGPDRIYDLHYHGLIRPG